LPPTAAARPAGTGIDRTFLGRSGGCLCVIKGLIAMRARHLLIGCVIGLGGIASAHAATAADAVTTGAGDCAQGAADSSAHASAAGGGDIVDLSRPSSTGGAHAAAPAAPARNDGDGAIHSGGGSDDAAPAHPRHASLGWQSLLPGSIQ
jgi:hypothetical protein